MDFKQFIFVVYQIVINLKATGSYVALSEIEIYVREDPAATTQTPYSNENGTGYILPEGADTNFEFDKVLALFNTG